MPDSLTTIEYAAFRWCKNLSIVNWSNSLESIGENAFTVSTEVAISPQFYGWLAGFGKNVEILAPESVREGMAEHIQQIMALYT